MLISSNFGEETTESSEHLERTLSQRDRCGGGEYWLSLTSGGFPCLAVCFSGDLAHVMWFPEDGHPGFRCLCTPEQSPLEDAVTLFVWDGCDPSAGEEVPNEFVLSRNTAIEIAKQFFVSTTLPDGHDWFEL